jgi:hypothetical protein
MGKGGGGGGQTTSTVTNTNIPEYARGYVENMLGATQNQLFNTSTNPTTGETELGSLRPYQAYGGTYDSSGNMTSYDPSKAIAGFTPMQQMAQNGIYNLQMPGQFDAASGYTADAMQRAANAGYNPGQFTMGEAYAPDVNYYQMDQPGDVYGETSQGTYLGNAPTADAQSGSASRLGFAPTIDNADQMRATQLGLSPEARAAQMGAAQLGQVPTYQGQQLSYTPQDVGYDRVNAPQLRDLQMQAAGNVSTGSFTQPGAAQSYMSSFMQQAIDPQIREAQRQADIASTKRASQMGQLGAFGGSREALENAEAARNTEQLKSDIQAKGLQAAFQSAQGQFNTEQQAQLQAELANQQVQQQTGVQNLSALLQTQGLGAQTGLTAQQLNQQAGMQTGQFNQQQQYNAALQNAQLAQQQQLANQSMQGQYGITQAQMQQAANAANQQSSNQIALANQQMAGQYGIQQGQFNQAAAAANQAANNQRLLANQGVLSQYGLTQGQMDQQMGMANLANRQQTALANQALSGQYGLQQGTMSQANNQFNAQQRQAANFANQQMAYNTNNQNLQANLGVQQLGAGQNMQSQLANQQARLSTQQAIEQSRQFGANYGQQMNAQQLAAAQQLAGIGGQQLTAQQGIYGLQNQIGGQQQQLQQQIINQSMQDYANAQQYPLMQLGTMSNMLRGLPMQASTTNMYQAAPNAITQGIGAVGAYGALNGAFGGTTGRKEGGVIHAAQGGIMSYDVGGEIESTLSKMDVDDLKRYAKESSSPSIKQMAARLIQEKSMPVPRMARGGILAFAKGKKVDELAAANEESLASPDDLTATDVQYKAPTIEQLYANQKPFMDRSGYDAMVERTRDYVYPERPRAPAPTAFQTLSAERPINVPTGASGFPSIPVPAQSASAPAAPPPAPPVPPPQGIAQAAATAVRPPASPVVRPSAGPASVPAAPPAGIKGAPGYPSRESVADLPEEATLRANAVKANEAAARPLSAFVEEGKDALRAAGISPENTGMQEYRSRIMAERANMGDEAARQKNLRLAEFFASWGSTPGATLVAGMSALKKTIPTLIEDEKERKKALRESDKIIYELDQAERLEKKGLVSEASAKKEKIADRAEKLNTEVTRSAEAKRKDEIAAQGHRADFEARNYATTSSAAANKYAADLRLQGDLAHSAASKANAEAAREGNNFNKAQTAYQLAQNARLTVDKEYDAVVNSKAYTNAVNDVKDLSTNETPQIKDRVAKSREYINSVAEDFKNRREMMDKSVRIAENRLNSLVGGTVIPSAPTGIPETPPQGAVRLKSK